MTTDRTTGNFGSPPPMNQPAFPAYGMPPDNNNNFGGNNFGGFPQQQQQQQQSPMQGGYQQQPGESASPKSSTRY